MDEEEQPTSFVSNRDLAELLTAAADDEDASHRRRALRRAARAAFLWPEEAAAVVAGEGSLTDLPSVGPWIERRLREWLRDGSRPEPPEIRRDFLTRSEATAILDRRPEWRSRLRADLQMHTLYSDGSVSIEEMVAAAEAYGYEHVAITDHSKGLPIARGMPEERLLAQGREIEALNARLEERGARIRVLRSIEMNLSPEGEGDMDPDVLAGLDLVLAAFHSRLRVTEDQTERYIAALRNPTVNVLAHPRGRRYGVRLGLRADWERVLEEAARLDKALEVDAYPDRQDLNVELLRLAREAGVRISIGTDAHRPSELGSIDLGVAAVAAADIAPERVLNLLPREELLAWARSTREA